MKLKKVLVAALAGAMVLSVVPAGSYGATVAKAAETQEETVIAETPSGYELQEISQEILRSHASSNSENANPAQGVKGGPARWAFDEDEHWWHSNFQNGNPSAANRIYIQTGFDAIKNIKKLTYTPRTDDKGGIIKNYEIKVSTVDNPGENQENWTLVESGTFANKMTEQEVVFDEAVEAKWIRLIAKSESYSKSGYGNFATAKKIRVFEEVAVPVTDVTLNTTKTDLKIGETVQLTAIVTPSNASQEVVWSSDADNIATVNSETGLVTAHSAGTAVITATSTMYSDMSATCTVVVTRDDTELDAAIKEAEAKMREENFAQKYTEASIKALEEDLADARAAKENANLTVNDVKLIVESLKASVEGLQLKAVVTINNNDQTEKKYCEVGDQVKVVAKAAPDGKKFSHWTFNGTPICYTTAYTFTVFADMTVEAVYVDKEQEIEQQVSVTCNATYDKAAGKMLFTVKRSLPAGYTVKEHGIIITNTKGYQALGSNEAFVIGANGIVHSKGKTTGLLGNYNVTMTVKPGVARYAKGYVTYTNTSGETLTVYSDLLIYTGN